MTKLQVLLVLASAYLLCFSSAEELQITGGKIKGKLGKSEAGVEVREFLGIKYATAKRYEKAVPYSSWTGVQDATQFKDVCHQFGLIATLLPQTNAQSDDCLYLNVWVPAKKSEAKRPVMVFIHGGAFEGGSGVMEGQDLAAQGDVILVTMNYRLGPLGFMMGADLQTNQGLHDQLLALKWVKQNIHFFGGDASQVTLFGESAGAMSVSAYIFSPLAEEGLFKRGILQSGSLAVETLCNSKERSLEKTAILGAKVNCTEKDIGKLVECIKKVDVEQLKAASADDFVTNAFFVPVWGDELLPLQPQKALESGHFKKNLDLIYGTNRDEGGIFALFIIPEIMGDNNLDKSSIKKYTEKVFKKFNIGHSQEIIDYYSGKVTANTTQDDFKALISGAFGDYALVCPTILFGEMLAQKSSPNSRFYSYRLMDYKPAMGPSWMGVAHSSDLQYLFKVEETKKDADLYQLSKDVIHAWTQFAKTGVPGKMGNVEWAEAVGGNKAVKDYRTRYMSLETKHFKMVDRFFEATCNGFWKPKLFS